MGFSDLLDRMLGRAPAQPEDRLVLPPPPTAEDVYAALEGTEQMLASSALPSVVVARAERIVATCRDTVPRLKRISGSDLGYTVVATATDYLPEALGAYQRLPRRYADTRPVDGAKSSLMVLVDQLDLLGMTMDRVFDAVYRDDARELVAQGRFIAEKFGTAGRGGTLRIDADDEAPLPDLPATPTDDADDADAPASPLSPPGRTP